MYLFLRLFYHMQKAKSEPALTLNDTCVIPMRVSLLDTDIFGEMNNGRHLTLFDIGRFAFAVRTGLWREVKRHQWGFVVAGSTIRYRKRLHPFQRFEQHTRLVGRDARWVYFLQTHQRGDVWHSAALIRAGVVAKGKLLPLETALEALGEADWQPELPEWVQAWIDADAQWPWPDKTPT